MKKKSKIGSCDQAKLKKIERCMMCDKPAKYIRYTQFSGNHPFCNECAKLENAFGEVDNYEYWSAI